MTPAQENETRWFWLCQIAGWSVAGIAVFPAALAFYGDWKVTLSLVVFRETLGLLFSSLLRPWLRRWQDQSFGPVGLAKRAVPVALGATLLDSLLFAWCSYLLHPGALLAFASSFFIRSTAYLTWMFLYFWLRETLLARQRERRLAEIQLSATEAELHQLRAQINPHFLFNALTLIIAEAPDNPALVQQAAGALSEYLHYLLRVRGETISLGEEIDAIENYLIVERARYGVKLECVIDVQAESRSLQVPVALLLPLVENALKYAPSTGEPPWKIRVSSRIEATGFLVIRVENSGHWVAPGTAQSLGFSSTGTGLANLQRRLTLMFGHAARLAINTPAGFVQVSVSFPSGTTFGHNMGANALENLTRG